MRKYLNYLLPIFILMLCISSFIENESVYFFINFFMILFSYFFIILFIDRGKTKVQNNYISVTVLLYGFFIILLSRNYQYFEHSIIVFLMIYLFFVLIPEKVSSFKFIYLVFVVILIYTLYISFVEIISNSNTISIFLNSGFNAKNYVVPIFDNINYDATIISYGVVSAFVLWKITKNRLYVFLLLIEVLALVITFSRTNYLIILMTFMLYFIIILAKKKKKRLSILIFLVTGLGLTVTFFGGVLGFNILGQGNDLLSGRIDIWNDAIKIIKQSPLIGHGLYYWDTVIGYDHSTHNSYLNIMIEYGLLGLVLFGLFILSSINYGIKNIKYRDNTLFYPSIMIVSFSISLLVGMIFETRRVGGIRIIDFFPLLLISLNIIIYKLNIRNKKNKLKGE